MIINTLGGKLLAFFFTQLYHRLALFYDVVADIVSFGKWKEWVFSVLPLIKGNEILELGIGPGHLQMKMLEAHLNVIGLDESWFMIKLLHNKLAQSSRSIRRTAKIIRCSAQELPFPNHYFSAVVLTFPTNFIVDPNTISEIFRTLKVEGDLIILFGLEIIPESISEKFLAWIYRLTKEAVPDSHWRDEISSRFQAHGLQVSWHQVTYPPAILHIMKATKGTNFFKYDVK